MPDLYAATAAFYDLARDATDAGRERARSWWLAAIRPAAGPILDVGCGSLRDAEVVMKAAPEARLLALEPSSAMRALAMGRVAAHPEWFGRVTIRPEDFFSAPLPDRIGGALLAGVIGHFDLDERRAVWAELAARLAAGSSALIDLQQPFPPAVVDATEYEVAVVGGLSYRVIVEGRPGVGEHMRWRMTYTVSERDRSLLEEVAEFDYRHPEPGVVASEANDAGLTLEPVAGTSYWLLRRH